MRLLLKVGNLKSVVSLKYNLLLKLLGKPRHDQSAAATSDFAPDQAVPAPSSTRDSSDGPASLPPGVLGSTCPTQPTRRSTRA